MKRLIPLVLLALVPLAGTGAAQGATPAPDYKLKCKNGRYAKVWITHAEDNWSDQTLRAVNNCGKHSKQWLMIFAGNEDGSGGTWFSIQPGATYTNDTNGWEQIQSEGDLGVKLGRGVFCATDADPEDPEYGYVGAAVVYREGTTWRANCT